MKKYPYVAATLIILGLLCTFEMMQGFSHFRTASYNKAKDVIDVMLAVRKWNADVQDLYASSSHVGSNPYLKAEDRDIKLDRLELTRINPAYLTRLTSDVLSKSSSINVHMISQTPINPLNSATGWEKKGIKNVMQRRIEYSYVDYSDISNITFNYMRPVYIEKSCLSCHGYQGYKVGDVRGAISVSFPVTKEHNRILFATILTIMSYLATAALVLFLILSSRKKLMKAYDEKLNTINELQIEISRRERSEAALLVQARNSSASEILSLIAHHWRQPLNNIGLLVQSMKEEENRKELKSSADDAVRIIKDMSETIDLFTSSVRANRCARLEIKDMVFDVLRLLKPELETSSIEAHIICTLGGSDHSKQAVHEKQVFYTCGMGDLKCEHKCGFSDLFITGEEASFKQILLVMLKNSYDALLEISSSNNRMIKIIFEKEENHALIKVCDNGNAITPDVKARLFEPYFSTKGVEAGRGIGLFTARNLAGKFEDAAIFFDDSEGKCFVFRFKTC